MINRHIGYRPPYCFERLLEFFRLRALPGVEVVGNDFYSRTVHIALEDGGFAQGWVRVSDNPRKNALAVSMSESLLPASSQVIARIRRQFDVDCDPQAIHDGIAQLNEVVPGAAVLGTRLPGCFDPFETCCRAVLGQQVSVLAANKLAARIVEHHGTPIDTEIEGLTFAFPTPSDVLALECIEDAFGQLGVIKTRSRVINQIAQLLVDGQLDFAPGADVAAQMETLLAIKGVGPWTANYIAMRVLSHPDAFLESDAGVKHALPERTPKEIAALAQAWSPWRSYANICLWNSLS